jgi:hypothetical protein
MMDPFLLSLRSLWLRISEHIGQIIYQSNVIQGWKKE